MGHFAETGSLALGQNQGLLIYADSTGNYETLHGLICDSTI